MFDSIDDWVIIGVFFAILFWGSTKIPQLAHSMGRAVGEFKKGKMESERELLQSQSAPATTPAASTPRVVRDSASGR
jgi:sec-independent protein translocase protein TatA